MPPETETPDDEDVSHLLPRRRVQWPLVVIFFVLVVAVVFSAWLYSRFEQRGPSLRGPGHLVKLDSGGVWAFFTNDGTLVRVTPESAQALNVTTGRCSRLDGWLQGTDCVLEEAECEEGGLQDAVVERMRRLGLRFGYWAEGLESRGDTLEDVLETVEVYASMIQPQANDPQLVPLFRPLFADVLPAARREGLPPPVFISVRRNDLAIVRVTRNELAGLMALPVHVFAGAAKKGGWVVRSVVAASDGDGELAHLLIDPTRTPWPERLRERVVRVASSQRTEGRGATP